MCMGEGVSMCMGEDMSMCVLERVCVSVQGGGCEASCDKNN